MRNVFSALLLYIERKCKGIFAHFHIVIKLEYIIIIPYLISNIYCKNSSKHFIFNKNVTL